MKNLFINLLCISFLFFNTKSAAQTGQFSEVRVSTVKAFYEAIESNRHIIIDVPELDITRMDLSSIVSKANPKVKIESENLGFSIHKVHNLKISGSNRVNVFTRDEDERVIAFEDCSNIQLENLNIFHKAPAQISCFGEVLSVTNVNQFEVNNCHLNGSGTIALDAYESTHILIQNSEIFNNTNYFIYARSSKNIRLKNCHLFENILSENGFILVDADVVVEQCQFSDNFLQRGLVYPICDDQSSITFKNCTFQNNVEGSERKIIREITGNKNVVFSQSDFASVCDVASTDVDTLYSLAAQSVSVAASQANDADPLTQENKQNWIEINFKEQYHAMKSAGVSALTMDPYYTQIYDFIHRDPIISLNNIDQNNPEESKQLEIIVGLYALEAEKKETWLNELDKIFHFPLFSYWGKTNMGSKAMKEEYINSWKKLYASFNIINSITKQSTHFYIVDLDFIYITKKSKKLQSVHSLISIQFKNGKIVSINPVKS